MHPGRQASELAVLLVQLFAGIIVKLQKRKRRADGSVSSQTYADSTLQTNRLHIASAVLLQTHPSKPASERRPGSQIDKPQPWLCTEERLDNTGR